MYETIRLSLATIILVYLINIFFFTGCCFRNSKRAKIYGYPGKRDSSGGISTVLDAGLTQNDKTVPYNLINGFYIKENGLDHCTLHSTNSKYDAFSWVVRFTKNIV